MEEKRCRLSEQKLETSDIGKLSHKLDHKEENTAGWIPTLTC